jgi:molecular chaperone HtpG
MHTRAERMALEAEDLPCFSGLKLGHVRQTITEALSRVGHNGIFEQYTKHDISHIDRMLDALDWIIPESTWQRLTPADSLLHVLAIYLHDLGMLVTESEFAQRESSGWRDYVSKLYAGTEGDDYRVKVADLGEDAGERFLYQEYVRAQHGERVRAWISGTAPARLGRADAAMAEVAALLVPLPAVFREDLGLVCESHHVNDLGDITRYAISRPYGPSQAQEANIQYAAILLRTTDLLHITSDRTPSVAFRLIAPADPVSQEEWAKQMAVTAVRSKPALDDEGNVAVSAPRNTIEVCAQFTDEDGFFGLTAYLTYARRQLQQTFDWAAESIRRHGSSYEFPWRYIDDTEIRTSGFLRDSFEFTLDTKRVLDLLTGHTLYNNTSVVVRELVQNSLDAIRVHAFGAGGVITGKISIHWDSSRRRLSVTDNGTGMTQDVIERHLLRVGSSRYHDAEFVRQHPGFSPISRFGIGVLSTFMIADAVTITTVHADEAQGRQLSLRSVHGRYLIRLFEKDDPDGLKLGPHGTTVTLALRPSAKMEDIRTVVERWVVVPACEVVLTCDDEEPTKIGHGSIRDALRMRLEHDGHVIAASGVNVRDGDIGVEEAEEDGLRLAFAKKWSSHFQEWSLLEMPERRQEQGHPLGTCVEGIRVETETPGFKQIKLYAMANVTGPGAPRTDVSRSRLEHTPERLALLKAIYRQYALFVASEVEGLRERGFSLTWSAQEARYLAGPLLNSTAHDPGLLKGEIGQVPSIVVDDGSARHLRTPADVGAMAVYWTVESNFFRSAESLLREVPSAASVTALAEVLGAGAIGIPTGPVVTSGADYESTMQTQGREISRIVLRPAERRVDLAWASISAVPCWQSVNPPEGRGIDDEPGTLVENMAWHALTRRRREQFLVAREAGVKVEGQSSEIVVRSHGLMLCLPGSVLATFLIELLDRCGEAEAAAAWQTRLFVAQALELFCGRETQGAKVTQVEALELLERMRREGPRRAVTNLVDLDDLAGAIAAVPIRVFDSWAWNRGAGDSDD